METTLNLNDIIHHDKKLGMITKKEVILYIDNHEERIGFESIHNVKLIKKRIFIINTLLLLGSGIVFYLTYFFYHIHSIASSVLFILGFSGFLYSFYHKYYRYTIVIKEKDKKVHELKTTQMHRDSVKKFYFKIAKKIGKNKAKAQE